MKTKLIIITEMSQALIEWDMLLERSTKNDGTVTKEQLNEAEKKVRELEHELTAFEVNTRG